MALSASLSGTITHPLMSTTLYGLVCGLTDELVYEGCSSRSVTSGLEWRRELLSCVLVVCDSEVDASGCEVPWSSADVS